MTGIKRATTVDEIYQALRQKPLQEEELQEFYVDASSTRGKSHLSRLERRLRKGIGTNSHILFVGYKGCGKSTELVKLQSIINDDFLVFNYSVYEDLDPSDINYTELVVVTMERLFTFVKNEQIKISDKYLKKISNFLKNEEIQNISHKHFELSSAVGGDTKIGIPFIQEFFFKFSGALKGGKSIKTTITENLEPRWSELIDNCNALIREIKLNLPNGKKDILIIIEDLDKLSLSVAEELFYTYSSQITEIACNIIYTFPIALYYHISFNIIQKNFTENFELPMIKIADQKGVMFEKGVDKLSEIVEARMDLDLFEDRHDFLNLVMLCGGCLRDLFTLITEAAEFTQDDGRAKISNTDCIKSIKELKKDYKNSIAEYYDEKRKQTISAEQFYEVLKGLANSEIKKLDNTPASMQLKQNLCILGYNGDYWCDVHPIVKEILKEREN